MKRIVKSTLWGIAWLLALGCTAWAFGALRYDFPAGKGTISVAFALAVLAAIAFPRQRWQKLCAVFLSFAIVLAWWLTLKPSNNRTWQPDVARIAWADVDGDVVTLHNVRNCDYRTETDYTPHWETRTVRLSQITGMDIAICYWGSPYMAHPIVSFQFADARPVCFSIETRKEVGESYSAIGGIYRQYELIYIIADERDVIRLRTNFRKGEDIHLYRTVAGPDAARERFHDYLRAVNHLREHPVWYNALATNCTSAIRIQHAAEKRAPWDWRMLVNGKGDELLFERRVIATGGLPFAELRKRAHINPAANAANDAEDFSTRIRAGLPGF